MTKKLFVGTQIMEIDNMDSKRKPKSIKFALSYEPYLEQVNEDAKSLLDKLSKQMLGGGIMVSNLYLVWEEEEV